ncbi:EsaB/YukD family protein [Mycolicibacterium sp. Dal123E01]|uniref:EsaB/YukD family protein n=1 Tax=Mycolicibacterium sp. Dal123E01 TaxID=3457578 RepID=UPI00403EA1F5
MAETCLVSIRTGDREVDLALPAHLPIVELMPSVVDLIGSDDVTSNDVHLARVGGGVLDPAAALAQHGIRDGELLLLTPASAQESPVARFDTGSSVVEVVTGLTHPLTWVTRGRAGRIIVCWCAAMMMLLMYPGHPGLSGFLLMMSAISATSLLAWRLLDCAPLVFLPLAAVTMAGAATTVGAVAGWWPTTAAGPLLVMGALGTLVASARWSVRCSGLAAADLSDTELEDRTTAAHHRLTQLILTAAPAAALGAVITAATTLRPAVAAVFIGIVGAALLLQSRRLADRYHVAALVLSCGISATALVGLCAIKVPSSGPWLCAALLAAGAGAVWLPWRLSAAARRVIAVLDLAVSATVVPAAAAAAGAFEALL